MTTYRILPESIHTQVQPKFQNINHFIKHCWLSIIQIWLFLEILVQIKLTPLFSISPCRIDTIWGLTPKLADLNAHTISLVKGYLFIIKIYFLYKVTLYFTTSSKVTQFEGGIGSFVVSLKPFGSTQT